MQRPCFRAAVQEPTSLYQLKYISVSLNVIHAASLWDHMYLATTLIIWKIRKLYFYFHTFLHFWLGWVSGDTNNPGWKGVEPQPVPLPPGECREPGNNQHPWHLHTEDLLATVPVGEPPGESAKLSPAGGGPLQPYIDISVFGWKLKYLYFACLSQWASEVEAEIGNLLDKIGSSWSCCMQAWKDWSSWIWCTAIWGPDSWK